MLTVRAFQIANKILSMKRSIRIRDLSEMFHVSERSIKYDLDQIRYFFEKYNLDIKSQSGKGIWIDFSDEKREEMIRILAKLQQDNLYYNQSMRIHIILLTLFMKQGFVTAGSLAEHLNVNRNTVLNDLVTFSESLKLTDITLERKQRTGYRLKGKERDIRYYVEVQIQKSLSVYDIYMMTERIKNGNFDKPIRISLPEIYTKDYYIIESTLHKLFCVNKIENIQKENITLMIIRIIISFVRVKQNCLIGKTDLCSEEERMSNLTVYWGEMYTHSGLPVYKDEICYIEGQQDLIISNVDIGVFTTELIKHVSMKNNFPYDEDNTLYSRIVSHLTLSLKENIKENPFNSSILKNHSSLFLAVKDVSHKYLLNHQLIYNDSFISYIVLHFLVSQRNIKNKQKIRAVYVCATGRGAVKLIEKMIESEIREIEMVANCSLLEAEQVILKFQPDFVISIFPIESKVPVIVVEPVPTRENINFIKNLVNKQREDNMPKINEFDSMPNIHFASDAEEISQQVIMKGLNIYNQLMKNSEFEIKDDLEFAFLTHCMLLAHRYHFNKQYCNISTSNKTSSMNAIKNTLKEIGVHVNDDEIQSLLHYYKN